MQIVYNFEYTGKKLLYFSNKLELFEFYESNNERILNDNLPFYEEFEIYQTEIEKIKKSYKSQLF